MTTEFDIIRLKQDVIVLLGKIDRYKAQLVGITKEIESIENYISYNEHELKNAKQEELVDLASYRKTIADIEFKRESMKSMLSIQESVMKSKAEADRDLNHCKTVIAKLQKELDERGTVYEFKVNKE